MHVTIDSHQGSWKPWAEERRLSEREETILVMKSGYIHTCTSSRTGTGGTMKGSTRDDVHEGCDDRSGVKPTKRKFCRLPELQEAAADQTLDLTRFRAARDLLSSLFSLPSSRFEGIHHFLTTWKRAARQLWGNEASEANHLYVSLPFHTELQFHTRTRLSNYYSMHAGGEL
jgi:hypothetical protein